MRKPVSAPKTRPRLHCLTNVASGTVTFVTIQPCSDPAGDIMISSPRTSSQRPMSPAASNCSAVVTFSIVAISAARTAILPPLGRYEKPVQRFSQRRTNRTRQRFEASTLTSTLKWSASLRIIRRLNAFLPARISEIDDFASPVSR